MEEDSLDLHVLRNQTHNVSVEVVLQRPDARDCSAIVIDDRVRNHETHWRALRELFQLLLDGIASGNEMERHSREHSLRRTLGHRREIHVYLLFRYLMCD